jgi:hypothetical protein
MGEVELDVTVGRTEMPKETKVTKESKKAKPIVTSEEKETVSCLRNYRVEVRFIPKVGKITDPRHVLYGGMADEAIRTYTVPRLRSGAYVNVLTDDEKDFLEDYMGLEKNSLSIHRKNDNYWDNLFVPLRKQPNYLDLSDPNDYIKYKVLLANKDYIADSLQTLEDRKKATYQYVLVEEGEETSKANRNMSFTMQAYMEFGKYQDDYDTLRVLVEILDGKPISNRVKIEYLKEKINNLIQKDAKVFVRTIQDSLLPTKVLIKKAIEAGIISNRGGMLYLKDGGTPLCGDNEEPTINVAAKFLNLPKNQTLKFSIESKIKE